MLHRDKATTMREPLHSTLRHDAISRKDHISSLRRLAGGAAVAGALSLGALGFGTGTAYASSNISQLTPNPTATLVATNPDLMYVYCGVDVVIAIAGTAAVLKKMGKKSVEKRAALIEAEDRSPGGIYNPFWSWRGWQGIGYYSFLFGTGQDMLEVHEFCPSPTQLNQWLSPAVEDRLSPDSVVRGSKADPFDSIGGWKGIGYYGETFWYLSKGSLELYLQDPRYDIREYKEKGNRIDTRAKVARIVTQAGDDMRDFKKDMARLKSHDVDTSPSPPTSSSSSGSTTKQTEKSIQPSTRTWIGGGMGPDSI